MHDSDGKEKIDRARVTGKDGQAGRLTRQLQGRQERAVAEVSQSWVPAERTLRFWLPGLLLKYTLSPLRTPPNSVPVIVTCAPMLTGVSGLTAVTVCWAMTMSSWLEKSRNRKAR